MSTLFNYGTPGGKTGGWSAKSKHFEVTEIDSEVFTSNVKSRENPRVAVPSPFARLKIVKDAFESVSNGEHKAEDRDLMLVSQVLDIFELLFENGLQKNKENRLSIRRVNMKEIPDKLMESEIEDKNNGTYLFGRTLKDYANREKFGLAENPMLFAICSVNKPLAITSPTSVFLPTPNYKDPEWSSILINGFRPIFSERRNLISRNREFVLFLYAWYKNLRAANGGVPEALKSFGNYIEAQKKFADKELLAQIEDASSLSQYAPITSDGLKVEIWKTPLYSISERKEGSLIEDKSDLILKASIGDQRPLILTTNNVYSDMVYTSGQTIWDRKNPGFEYGKFYQDKYSGRLLKDIPIKERTTLPNGQAYPFGFIYEHDFLADTLIKLPYKLNNDKFFDGNVEGLLNDSIGLIPPIKEEYFNYFTAADLRENLSMKVYHETPEEIEKVEVLLKLPTSKNREIVFKKTYFVAESLKTAIEEVDSHKDRATGLIGRCGVAVNALPFIRAFADNNYYAFQLLVDSMNHEGCDINLNACSYDIREGEKGHDLLRNFSSYVRRTEQNVPVITSYSLDGDNFDYLKLTFKGQSNARIAHALLIPKEDIPSYTPDSEKSLEFCFDFGTSNTFVAVKQAGNGGFMDFKLPSNSDLMVSTIHTNPFNPDGVTPEDLVAITAFIAYGKQEFLPKIENRLPFPIPTVMAAPKSRKNAPHTFAPERKEEDTEANPFLTGSIPFLYGSEDYGSKTNEIITDLKWNYNRNSKTNKVYTESFINELLFLAQVFTMNNGADLKPCKIFWTYPLSMDKNAIKRLQELWIKGYNRFFVGDIEENEDFDDNKNVSSFPESMAPMLYYTSSNARYRITSDETTLSVDIGGGTCDLVIIPCSLSNLKLASFKFGAECIFGIDQAKAEDIPMFKSAINSISKALKAKAIKSNPDYRAYEIKADELVGLLNRGGEAKELATYLFNLPNNPLFKGLSKQIDFNQWIQAHPHYHTVFIYYYSALIFYIAEMWKTFKNADKPSRILFSGSGSKMFNILCEGRMEILSEYTTELFNIFAKDELDEDDLEEDIRVKMEEKEPKQITAKGVLSSVSPKMNAIKGDMQKWKSASKSGKDYILHFDMVSKKGEELTYGRLEDEEVVDNLYDKIMNFHEGLMSFINARNDDFDEDAVENMQTMFTARYKKDRKWRRAIEKALRGVLDNTTASMDSEYPDVPFFEVIKSFIKDAMIPED